MSQQPKPQIKTHETQTHQYPLLYDNKFVQMDRSNCDRS